MDCWSAGAGKKAAVLQVEGSDWCKAFRERGKEIYFNLKIFEEILRWAVEPLCGKGLGVWRGR